MIRIAVFVLVLLLLGTALWQGRHTEPWAGWLGKAQQAAGSEAAGVSIGKAAALRKCLQGSRVVYTDGPCPAGSREQAVSEGRVSVVPATPVPALPPAAAASLPNARDILGRPDDGTLRDQRMERQINSN